LLLEEGTEDLLHIVHVVIDAELDETVRLEVQLILVQNRRGASCAILLCQLRNLR
jgi:hypothetical protein